MSNFRNGKGPTLGHHATHSGWLLGDHKKWDIICIIGEDPSNPVYAYHYPETQALQTFNSNPSYQAFQNEVAFFVNSGFDSYLEALYDFDIEQSDYFGGPGIEEGEHPIFNPIRMSNRRHVFI